MKNYLLFSTSLIILLSCANSKFVNTAELPDTYQCTYMKEICKEAREFEQTYTAMKPEEKNEFKNVLKAYRNQCNDALKLCQESSPVPDSATSK